VYLAARGTRRWRLCHPGQAGHLRIGGMTDANRTKIHPLLNVNEKLAPLIKFITIDVQEGDLLYVPPQWWHVVGGGIGKQPGEFSCGIKWFFTVELTGHIPDMYLEEARQVVAHEFSSTLAKKLKAAVDEDEKQKKVEGKENRVGNRRFTLLSSRLTDAFKLRLFVAKFLLDFDS
jgi:ribosomal protein L16 Arg81 hydroxylase